MIRSTSEAICESIGSIMKIHTSSNRNLQPDSFNMEMVLRVNLAPLHLLENLVNEVFASNSNTNYIRKGTKISQIVSKDINKSAAISTFEKNGEKKSRFPHSFWLD